MSGSVSSLYLHVSYLQLPKIKGSHVIVYNTDVKSPQQKTKFTFFELK